MIDETNNGHWVKLVVIVLITFLVSYFAFYLALKHHLRNLHSPFYQVERMEKMLDKQERDFEKFTEKNMNSPFEPKMRPMMVNLVKEPNEYKVIVDLHQLDGNENAVNVEINGDELTVKGQMDKKIRGTEKIINFTQTYYLEEKLISDKMTKEKKGEKYIITIPFENED